MVYILKRDHQQMLMETLPGGDPLLGHRSWTIQAGPFDTVKDALSYLAGVPKTLQTLL